MAVAHLSNIFKYTDQFGIMGHQMGRKVGDMLELVAMATLSQDGETKAAMTVEPKVEGFTGAEHKVEFAFYDEDRCRGLVECKKVGVEVTKHGRTKREPLALPIGASYSHSMRPKWVDRPSAVEFTYAGNSTLRITVSGNTTELSVSADDKIKIAIDVEQHYHVIAPRDHLLAVPNSIGACHIFTVRTCTSDTLLLHIDTCLSGPQTIEKAKQIAWVALDVRKQETDHWGREDLPANDDRFKAVLVIGESSHWEEKSRKVVRAALDHNFIVEDELLVLLFERFVSHFGRDGFESFITKDAYGTNKAVTGLVDDIISDREYRVFADLDTGRYHRVLLRDKSLVTMPV